MLLRSNVNKGFRIFDRPYNFSFVSEAVDIHRDKYKSCRAVWTSYSYLFKHNQQDATLHNGIYYYKCSACFRRFLRPSSGAQNCIHNIGYLSRFFCRVYSFELL